MLACVPSRASGRLKPKGSDVALMVPNSRTLSGAATAASPSTPPSPCASRAVSEQIPEPYLLPAGAIAFQVQEDGVCTGRRRTQTYQRW